MVRPAGGHRRADRRRGAWLGRLERKRIYITRAVNERFMRAFRANAGRVPAELEGVPCLILTTNGAQSGLRRPVPLACHSVDGKLLVIASMGGARVHPPWFHNLRADPEVTVEKDSEPMPRGRGSHRAPNATRCSPVSAQRCRSLLNIRRALVDALSR